MPRGEHSVHVKGTGVAALTCARLLDKQGWKVRLETVRRHRPIHLLLGQTTASLLSALWNDSTLLEGAHPIRERAVRWGGASQASVLAAPGIVVEAQELIRRLESRFEFDDCSSESAEAWEVEAHPPRPGVASPMLEIGRRHAWIAQVKLKSNGQVNRCAMETLEWGWAFLLPVGDAKADLQFVSVPGDVLQPEPEQVVAQSRMLGSAVAEIDSWLDPIASMPKFHPAPARPGRLAVGEAALSFDPISGDGVGHALRGAVLAATTLDDIARGHSSSACIARYAETLRRAMTHHLEICLKLYGGAMSGQAWQHELDAMRSMLARLNSANPEPVR